MFQADKANMSEPRADNRPEHQIQTERGQIFEIPVFPAVKLRHDLKAEEKSERDETRTSGFRLSRE